MGIVRNLSLAGALLIACEAGSVPESAASPAIQAALDDPDDPAAQAPAQDGNILPDSTETRSTLPGWVHSAPEGTRFRVAAPCQLQSMGPGIDAEIWMCQQLNGATRALLWKVARAPTTKLLKGHTETMAYLNDLENGAMQGAQDAIESRRVRFSKPGEPPRIDQRLEMDLMGVRTQAIQRRLVVDDQMYMVQVMAMGQPLPETFEVFLNSFTVGEVNGPKAAGRSGPEGPELPSTQALAIPELPTAPHIKAAKLRRTLRHKGDVWGIAWSPDGTKIASACNDGTVAVWSAKTGKRLLKIEADPKGATGVAWSPDGSQIATVGFLGTLRAWNSETGELDWQRLYTGGMRDVDYHPTKDLLIAVGDRGDFPFVRPSVGEQQRTLADSDGVRGGGVHFSRQGDIFALVGGPGVSIWNADGTIRWKQETNTGAVWDNALSPSGKFVAASYEDKGMRADVRVWSTADGSLVNTTDFGDKSYLIPSVAWASNGLLAAGDAGGKVHVWRPGDAKPKVQAKGMRNNVISLEFSPDGTMLAAGSYDNVVKIWTLVLADE